MKIKREPVVKQGLLVKTILMGEMEKKGLLNEFDLANINCRNFRISMDMTERSRLRSFGNRDLHRLIK